MMLQKWRSLLGLSGSGDHPILGGRERPRGVARRRVTLTTLVIAPFCVVCLSVAGLFGPSAQAAEVTLTVHHFLSPKATIQARVLEPWAERLKTQSNGRIEVKFFPAMSLGGKPGELYGQVRDGTADIIWTLTGYTPGVFPRAEVFELPGVHGGSALATNLAIQDLMGLIAEDFLEVHPLLVHVHDGNALHMRDRRVAKVSDLSGLKLRTPSRTGAWMIESWGAEPVGMPVPALPQALSTGVVDGALVPFEVMPPLKLHELTKFSMEGAKGQRFGTSVFLLAMNKERYDGLPDDLKAIIDANSGANLAKSAAEVWTDNDNLGKRLQTETGAEIVVLDAVAQAEFDALAKTVVQRWIDEVSGNGIEGAALVRAARSAVVKHTPK